MPLYMQKPIIPTALTSRSMNAYFLNGLLKVKKSVEEDYRKTTATWQEKHPVFKVRIYYAGGFARVVGGTSGASLDNKVWNWLDKGTSVRHAVMTRPFEPKTWKRYIGSTQGVGRMSFVSSKIQQPGIKAREFTQAIQEHNLDILYKEMDDAVFKSLARGTGPLR